MTIDSKLKAIIDRFDFPGELVVRANWSNA